ncbi:MAG: hypothetical protein M3512_04105 [Bacteroidota bacterium]|nr:hypothetical protein [Bacteroidota bacterium]
MKKVILIFGLFFLFTSCDKEDPENIIVKNATIYIDQSEKDNCMYSIKTEDNEFFATRQLPVQSNDQNFKARITYTITEGTINCGFGGYLTEIIITNLVRL